MNRLHHKASTLRRKLIAVLLSFSFLLSCTDPVTTAVVATIIDAGVGGTGIVRGAITGFGSVYVNGVKFDVSESSFEVDGISGKSQADLDIGMVVTINGNINPDGVTGKALSLIYDDDIEGPILVTPDFIAGSDNTQKQFTILGYNIIVDSLTTRYKNTTFATLSQNDIVEISGYKTATNSINATFVKKSGTYNETSNTPNVELKGTISALTATNFKLGTVTVNYDNATELDLNNTTALSNGMYVEASGSLHIINAISQINATKIEQEELEFNDPDKEINLSGLITDYVDNTDFKVNGQRVNAGNANDLEPDNALSLLTDGVKVNVEGIIQNGILIAEEIEVSLNEVRLSTTIHTLTTTNGNVTSLKLNYPTAPEQVSVIINESTQFEDETNTPITPFSINNLIPSDFVEIEASVINQQLIASTVKRTETDETVLQGTLESFNTNTLTILGITYNIDSSTDFDGYNDATSFFNALNSAANPNIGDILKIKDDDANGIANSVKLQD